MFFLGILRYHLKILIKRCRNWILMCLNFLIFSILLLIIPLIQGKSPLMVWMQPFISVGALMLPVITIFASSVGCDIFKESSDSGGELIVISKPISRWEYAIVKIGLFIFVMLVFSTLCSLFGLFSSFLPNFDKNYLPSFVLSIFVGTLCSSIFFGSIGMLLVQKFKHITSIIIVTFITAFFTIMLLLTPMIYNTPAEDLSKRYNISLSQKSFIKKPHALDESSKKLETVECIFQSPLSTNLDTVIFEDNNATSSIAELYNKSESKTFFNENYYLNIAAMFSSMFNLNDLSPIENSNINISSTGIKYLLDDNQLVDCNDENNQEFVNIFDGYSNKIYFLLSTSSDLVSSFFVGNYYEYIDSSGIDKKIIVKDNDLVYKSNKNTKADEFVNKVMKIKPDQFAIDRINLCFSETFCNNNINGLTSEEVAKKLFEAKLQSFYRLANSYFFTSSANHALTDNNSIQYYLFYWIIANFDHFEKNYNASARLNLCYVKTKKKLDSNIYVKQPIYKVKFQEIIPKDVSVPIIIVGIFLVILSSSIIYTRLDIK